MLSTLSLKGQVLSGKVSTVNGVPIPYATIYIHEMSAGIVADGNGAFQTRLSEGTYTVEARCLGYQTQVRKVDMAASNKVVQFILAEKTQVIQGVTVRPSDENPAYDIMRHAIARAPYHLYQVESYTSDSYLKGSAKIESIPMLMKAMIKDKKMKSMIGQLFVLESHNQISYQSPNKYVQRVVAYKSSIPKEMEPKGGIRMITSNIYASKYDDVISPLSTQAFRYYKFALMDDFENGNHLIYKIRITPKIAKSNLYSGYIYIVDADWSVFALDLSMNEMGTVVRNRVDFQEIQPGAFLPITYNMNVEIGTMGVKGYARLYSSIKYKGIKLKSQIKNKQNNNDITELLSVKKKLSTSEALSMAKLSTKMLEPEELKKKRKSLEIRNESPVVMQVDSMAKFRDSLYWETVRKVPLLVDEEKSFQRVDSISFSKSVKTTSNGVEIGFGNEKGNLFMGGRIAINDSTSIRYNGLLKGVLKEYNFVDGLWLGQKFSLNLPLHGKKSLSLTPEVYYVTGRKTINWNVNAQFNYLPILNGQFTLMGGSSSADIQKENGSSRLLNSLSSLLAGYNVIRFYKSNTFKFENCIDIANGLRLNVGGGYDNRTSLANSTTFHLLGKEPKPNIPDDAMNFNFLQHSATTAWASLSYTPRYYYRIIKGRKVYDHSDYPTLTATYQTAFRLTDREEQSEYKRLTLGINQNIELGIWSRLSYSASVGSNLSSKRMFAPDNYYFSTMPLSVAFNSFDTNFALLPSYTYAPKQWAEAHVSYMSDYLLLKRLPFLQKYMISESFHLNFMHDNSQPYYEAGYSVGLGKEFRCGVFGSFKGKEYQNVGVRVILPFGFW